MKKDQIFTEIDFEEFFGNDNLLIWYVWKHINIKYRNTPLFFFFEKVNQNILIPW